MFLRAPVALAAAFAVFGAVATGTTVANGRSIEVFRAVEGEYEIIVALQPEKPTVGAVHFTITPVHATTSVPVTDARVEIVARGPEETPAYHTVAVNSRSEPRYYDANLTLERPGRWTLTIDVSSEAMGQATISMPLFVEDRPLEPGLASTFVWLLVIVAFAGGVFYLWRTSRRLTAGRPNESESSR